MTRRKLFRYIIALIVLGIVLGAGAGTADAETRRTYLLAVVVLYTVALVVWILAAILLRVYPDVDGLVERYLKQEQAPLDVPDEVKSLTEAVRSGRRSWNGFESSLRPLLDSLAGNDTGGFSAGLMPDDAEAIEGVGAEETQSSPPVQLMEAIKARLRKGPSIKELEAMLDRIEET